MAIGDDAVAAGMTIVNGATAGSAAAIDDYINRAEDYTANGPTYWKSGVLVPVAKGGTGASTAAAARTNLDVFAKINTLNTNGTYNIEVQWDGTNFQFFVNGVFKKSL